MEFRKFLQITEGNWWGETATLYHGTSSALLSAIKDEGVQPPKQGLLEYSQKLAKSYFPDQDVPHEVSEWIMRYEISLRLDIGNRKISNVIYLSTHIDSAQRYSESYYRTGGEIANGVWRAANIWYCKQRGLEHPKDTCVDPPYKNAKPIVVEVAIPKNWVLENALEDRYNKVKTNWNIENKFSGLRQHYKTFENLLKSMEFEVRIDRVIPPTYITRVHRNWKPQL